MTVIFSNRQDDDNILLQRIWQGIDNVNVIEITPSSVDWEDDVDNALIAEDDTLILVGHGSPNGLYYPMYETGEYIIHQNNVGLIHARSVVCIWCYASSFCADNHLNGFCSSMFISNPNEALDNICVMLSQDEINNTNTRIYGEINEQIRNNVPLNEWVMRLGVRMDVEDAVDTFNRQGLIYIND